MYIGYLSDRQELGLKGSHAVLFFNNIVNR